MHVYLNNIIRHAIRENNFFYKKAQHMVDDLQQEIKMIKKKKSPGAHCSMQ